MRKIFIIIIFVAFYGLAAFTQQLTVVVSPFEAKAGVSNDDAEAITELLISELVADKSVKVVDRNNFDKITAEMKFQLSDWSDASKVAVLGKALNANCIIRGTAILLGSRYVITANILDINTAQILYTSKMQVFSLSDVYDEISSFVKAMLPQLPKPPVETDCSINVTTQFGGTLYFKEGITNTRPYREYPSTIEATYKKIAALWDMDTREIPIDEPGTYTVAMTFADGTSVAQPVTISARGSTTIKFGIEPPKNLQWYCLPYNNNFTIYLEWNSSAEYYNYSIYYGTNANEVEATKIGTINYSDGKWNQSNNIYAYSCKINKGKGYYWVSSSLAGQESGKGDRVEVPDYLTKPVPGGLAIIKYVGAPSIVTVPAQIDGNHVVAIGDMNATDFSSGLVFGLDVGNESLVIPEGVSTIGAYAFGYCRHLQTITIPASVKNIAVSAFTEDSISNISVDKNNPYYSSENGVLFSKDKKILIAYPNGKRDTYFIPRGVTTIASGAFAMQMDNVIFPDSLCNIEEMAFSKEPYKIIIGANVQIHEKAFCNKSFRYGYYYNNRKAGLYKRTGENKWGYRK